MYDPFNLFHVQFSPSGINHLFGIWKWIDSILLQQVDSKVLHHVSKITKAYRRKTEQEERIRNAGIEQIMGPVGDLAAGIAHEIDNPVGIMVEEAGWIDDLLQEVDLPEQENLQELKRALKQIQKARRAVQADHAQALELCTAYGPEAS